MCTVSHILYLWFLQGRQTSAELTCFSNPWIDRQPSSTGSKSHSGLRSFQVCAHSASFSLGRTVVQWGCGMLLEILYAIGNILLEISCWKCPIGNILLKLICILPVPFCAYLKWFPVVPVPVNPWTNLLVQLGSYRSSLPTWSVGLLWTSGKTLESLPQQSLMEKSWMLHSLPSLKLRVYTWKSMVGRC